MPSPSMSPGPTRPPIAIYGQRLIGRRENIPAGECDAEGFDLVREEVLFGDFHSSAAVAEVMNAYANGGGNGHRRIDKRMEHDYALHPDVVAALIGYCRHLEEDNINVEGFKRALGVAQGWLALRPSEDGSIRTIIYRRITD